MGKVLKHSTAMMGRRTADTAMHCGISIIYFNVESSRKSTVLIGVARWADVALSCAQRQRSVGFALRDSSRFWAADVESKSARMGWKRRRGP